MSEYLRKNAVLEWLDDRRYKSPWIESFRDRLESGAYDAEPNGEVQRLRAALEQLIEDYERRFRSAITMIDDPNTPNEQRIRVHGKKEAYRTFIHELQALSTATEPINAEKVERVREGDGNDA